MAYAKARMIIVIGVAAALLVLCAGAAGTWVWYQNALPVYVMGEAAPEAGIATNTLRHGDDLYICGYQEWPLLSTDGAVTPHLASAKSAKR